MSKWDVARALKASDLPAPAKLIMWDMIDTADVETAMLPEEFTPSLNDLVRTTSLSRSTVKRELNRLERAGWVIRDRPDPVKARTEFARTGYRLAVPPRPTESLGPGPRPTVDPDLGPEGAEARPTVGRIPIPHHLDLDPSLLPIVPIVRATGAVAPDEEKDFIEWMDSKYPGRSIEWWRTVADKGDLTTHAAQWRAERAARPQKAQHPPWCGEDACDPSSRQREDPATGKPKRCRCHAHHGQPLARRA